MELLWSNTSFPQLSQLETFLSCSICKDPFQAPVVSSICHHSYCSFCIRNCFSTGSNRCPVCNVELLESHLVKVPVLEELSRWWIINGTGLFDTLSLTNNSQTLVEEIQSTRTKIPEIPTKKKKSEKEDTSLISPSSISSYFYIPRKLTEANDVSKKNKPQKRKLNNNEFGSSKLRLIKKDDNERKVVVLSDTEDVIEIVENKGKKKEEEEEEKEEKSKSISLSGFLKRNSSPSLAPKNKSNNIPNHLLNPKPINNKLQKLPKLNFSAFSVPKIKEKFRFYDIPLPSYNYTKVQYINYYNYYHDTWNANLDSKYPMTKSQINSKIKTWERNQDLNSHNLRLQADFEKKNNFSDKNWIKKHNEKFKELIKVAKESKEQTMNKS